MMANEELLHKSVAVPFVHRDVRRQCDDYSGGDGKPPATPLTAEEPDPRRQERERHQAFGQNCEAERNADGDEAPFGYRTIWLEQGQRQEDRQSKENGQWDIGKAEIAVSDP